MMGLSGIDDEILGVGVCCQIQDGEVCDLVTLHVGIHIIFQIVVGVSGMRALNQSIGWLCLSSLCLPGKCLLGPPFLLVSSTSVR